MNRPIILIVIV